MTTDDKIRAEKLQYDINREAAKISPFSSGKIDKYEYHTGEERANKLSLHNLLQEKLFKNKWGSRKKSNKSN